MFKNAKIRDIGDVDLTLFRDKLEDTLEACKYSPCTTLQSNSSGFVTVEMDNYTENLEDKALFLYKVEKKIIPSSVVTAEYNNRVELAEEREGRKLAKIEKLTIKEAVIDGLLEKALSDTKTVYGYFDFGLMLLIVDTTSDALMDEITEKIRQHLGTFPVIPLDTGTIVNVFNDAIINGKSNIGDFSIDQSYELASPEKEKLKATNVEMCDEFKALITQGMDVKSLELSFNNDINFIFTDTATIKKIKLSDVILDAYEE